MIDWRTMLVVLVGGGIGSVCRYIFGVAFVQRFGAGFPYGTLAINLLGCLLIGIISELAITRSVFSTQLVRSFLVIGVLGGFTTFSTFAYDAVTLGSEAEITPALIYICISVVGGIIAAFMGIALVRSAA